MEPSSTPNELPKDDPSLPGTPANPPADVPKSFGSRLRKLAKTAMLLSLVLVPILLVLVVAFAPRHESIPATRSEKLTRQQRQLEIEQAERDAQSVAERNR